FYPPDREYADFDPSGEEFEKALTEKRSVVSHKGLARLLGGRIIKRGNMTLEQHYQHLQFLDANRAPDDLIWNLDRAWTLAGVEVLGNFPAGTTRRQVIVDELLGE